MLLNHASRSLALGVLGELGELRVGCQRAECGSTLLDFGVTVEGSLEAGCRLAEICMAGLGEVALMPPDRSIWCGPQVQVHTDHPVEACLAAQYAGWPIQVDKFFAMGSGPMRVKRGKESLLTQLAIHDESDVAVGVLECDRMPGDDVCRSIAESCSISPANLILCVAPTRSLAGVIQVVARSIETALHKLHELGFDVRKVLAATGTAPISPPSPDFATGIGRTNDAILYGGQVTLWIRDASSEVGRLGPRVPSKASHDWGRPFHDVFAEYQFDFYKVDPHLFAPAVLHFQCLDSGQSFQFGELRPDLLETSFGLERECK